MQFGLVEMFQAMSVLAKIVSFILIGLSVISIYLLIERTMFYAKAKNLSKAAARSSPSFSRPARSRKPRSWLPRRNTRTATWPSWSRRPRRNSSRARKPVFPLNSSSSPLPRMRPGRFLLQPARLKKGLSVLATIAISSPFIGLFGTISGIINAFKGMAATGSGGIAAVASGIAEALVTTAFGIGVAIIALWCYNYLSTRTETYDAEMSNTDLSGDRLLRPQKQ